jgi:hypothetical protein
MLTYADAGGSALLSIAKLDDRLQAYGPFSLELSPENRGAPTNKTACDTASPPSTSHSVSWKIKNFRLESWDAESQESLLAADDILVFSSSDHRMGVLRENRTRLGLVLLCC